MGMELSAILIVSTIIKVLIDRIRKHWPSLDGDLVNVVALILGFAATFVPDVGTFDGWVMRVQTAVAMTGLSALFTDGLTAVRERQ
jgi:hypothetical protein